MGTICLTKVEGGKGKLGEKNSPVSFLCFSRKSHPPVPAVGQVNQTFTRLHNILHTKKCPALIKPDQLALNGNHPIWVVSPDPFSPLNRVSYTHFDMKTMPPPSSPAKTHTLCQKKRPVRFGV